MKKKLMLLSVIAICICLVGCGKKEETKENTKKSNTSVRVRSTINISLRDIEGYDVDYDLDDESIKGDDAYAFLNKKMIKFENLISKIDSKLIECLKLNVKEYDGDIDYCVMETGERLSMIEILLEELLNDINAVLDEDDLL